MKHRKNTIFYIVTLGSLFAIIWLVLHQGKLLEAQGLVANRQAAPDEHLWDVFWLTMTHPLAVFILQMITIIVTCQMFGLLFRKIGQPAVMGEIVAGIILGPSLAGALLPAFSAFVFPPQSLGNLQMLSQVGLILFMFVIGMELDLDTLKKKAGAAVVISHASIVIPYGLGVALSYFMYRTYAPANIPFYAFALFMGIAMSITAFPVLARIIRERKLSQTRLGTIAITCAAADDITAWSLLAIVIAVVKAGSVGGSVYTLLLALLFVMVMLYVVKPLLRRLTGGEGDNILKRSTLAILLTIMLVSAWCCEVIGIHALFGAFMAGIVMPHDFGFRKMLIDKIEDVALVLLLPLFFVFTGLRTQIGLLNEPSLWLMCGVIILTAITGKFAGSAIAARITGETAYESLSIGVLMNTRGLVELVVLNIGYDLGILTPEVFTMLVIMALFTTFMTSPALNMLNRIYKKEAGHKRK